MIHLSCAAEVILIQSSSQSILCLLLTVNMSQQFISVLDTSKFKFLDLPRVCVLSDPQKVNVKTLSKFLARS